MLQSRLKSFEFKRDNRVAMFSIREEGKTNGKTGESMLFACRR